MLYGRFYISSPWDKLSQSWRPRLSISASLRLDLPPTKICTEENIMTTINLKDYYPWYLTNEYIEVTDEVAEALMASKRAEAAHAERVRYNRAY